MKPHPIIIDYSKYPFLITPVEYLKSIGREGVALEDLLRVGESRALLRAYERVEQAILEGEVKSPLHPITLEDEVLGYHLSIVLLSLVGDKWLARRYAEAESKRVEKELDKEPLEYIVAIAEKLGLKVETSTTPILVPLRIAKSGRLVFEELEVEVPITDYLKATRLIDEPAWRLENQVLGGGVVYLSKKKTSRLIAEIVADKIEESIIFVREVPRELKSIIDKIRELLKSQKKPLTVEYKVEKLQVEEVGVYPELFPPCIKELYDSALRGVSLPHHGRFALATFLLRIGADTDHVVEVFSKMPDFNEQKTRYQVEHLAGSKGSRTKYMTYSCETMRTLGLCVGECKGKNPLVVYLKRYIASSRTQKRSSRTR